MKRSGPLARRTPLQRRTPLRSRMPLRPSGPPSATPRPARRAKRDPLYDAAKAAVFVRARGRCEFRIDGVCTGRAEHPHHRRRRRYDRRHLTLAAICHACHDHVHDRMGAEAFRLGFLLPNIDVSGDDPWTPPGDREAA